MKSRRVYSPFPLAARALTLVEAIPYLSRPKSRRGFSVGFFAYRLGERARARCTRFILMPTFDVTSEVDMQEIRNAVDQASREVATRFDFKGTDSTVELGEDSITLNSANEDRLTALRQVLEEKMVRRNVSLKALDYGEVEQASGGRARQHVALTAGISSDKAKELNKFIKALGIKGIQSSTQGEQLRVQGKKRDSLQEVMAAIKGGDFDIPLQFGNFRD